jgi:hypothetical protein
MLVVFWEGRKTLVGNEKNEEGRKVSQQRECYLANSH